MLPRALITFIVAMVTAFVLTPLVRRLAFKIKAVDVPKDSRRMHKKPTPLIGGLAIFAGFMVAVVAFSRIDREMLSIIIGACIIIAMGIIDDIHAISPLVKLCGQVVAALIPVLNGVVIQNLTNPFADSGTLHLGIFSVPVTVFWVVAIVNAVNFIDGLDGLACGVSAVSSITMFIVAYMVSDSAVVLAMAALAGACLGFLPFNFNPAKIFMGDTGSMFLGFILATVSVQGLFKMYAVVSFAVPFVALALPLSDIVFAVVRRVARGQSPFAADRGHIHHKLIDMGLDQKQSVLILYCLSIVLGVISVIMTKTGEGKLLILAIALIFAVFIALSAMLYSKQHSGDNPEVTDKKE